MMYGTSFRKKVEIQIDHYPDNMVTNFIFGSVGLIFIENYRCSRCHGEHLM